MSFIKKLDIATGIFWIEIAEADLRILCGCPEDSIKHLIKQDLIQVKKEDGVMYETGPNVILLSEKLLQNKAFSNLSEFPVLHMLYKQGMIIPDHPNNTGLKPILIGEEEQVKAQIEYIYKGNYGITDIQEYRDLGVDDKFSTRILRCKRKFAFEKFIERKDLIEGKFLKEDKVEIRNNVFVKRTGENHFEIIYKNESVNFCLNLKDDEMYERTYDFPKSELPKGKFVVIHSGAGDGWDPDRSCTGSIIRFNDQYFLIDVGPDIHRILDALSIPLKKIKGVFLTHGHDDHFVGLLTLPQVIGKTNFYAAKVVRKSITMKLEALLGTDYFNKSFDAYDLNFNEWNNIEGMDVKPLFSPHPVDTSIFIFRSFDGKKEKTYGHYADIVDLSILKEMINNNEDQPGITERDYDRVRKDYLKPLTVKKIDIGGGIIHGNASDFTDDCSEKLILGHTSIPLNNHQLEVGVNMPFGSYDILIP